MVLSGTLQEFILADIFQILAQQKATGRLILTADRKTGQAILLNGVIIAAFENNETFQAKLASFLLTVKGVPEHDVDDLLARFGSSLVAFAQEIVVRKYLTLTDLVGLVQNTLEDIACSLFSWNSGSYHFESIDNVATWHLGGVSLPSDFIIMEAMRRIDESKRINARVSDDMIFVPTGHGTPAQPAGNDPVSLLAKPDQYLLSFIDGLSGVGILASKVFLTKARVYETLFRLWEDDIIAPLPAKVTRSIRAAVEKRPYEYHSVGHTYAIVIGILLAAAVFLVVTGMTAMRHSIFSADIKAVTALHNEVRKEVNTNKTAMAILEFRGRNGGPSPSIQQLVKEGLLDRRDAVGMTDKR